MEKSVLRRRRATAPKVRTGCLTCKVRRVKCDELKPSCLRCSKGGIVCEGYRDPKSKSIKPMAKFLTPKYWKDSTYMPLFLSTPAGLIFADEREWRYFNFYCSEIAVKISGPFRSSLWDRLVPQAGELEPFIKHAIIALGALGVSKIPHKSKSLDYLLSTDAHHHYALTQYCRALKGMREAIQAQTHDIRKALIACILVFCFESLQGHQGTACAHATSGANLLCQWKQTQSHSEGSKHSSGSLSISIEDDIYSAFSGLDLQALLFMDTRSPEDHLTLEKQLNGYIEVMPDTIENLYQATSILKLIVRRNCHFVAAARSVILQLPADEEKIPASIEVAAHLRHDNNTWSIPVKKPSEIPPFLLQERERYKADLRRWEDATRSLFARYSVDSDAQVGSTEKEQWLMITLLKIHVSVNLIVLTRGFFPPETAYDVFLPEFTAITDLSYAIHPYLTTFSSSPLTSSPDSLRNSTSFHFEVGIIPGLAMVGNLCRHREVRSKAIQLLLSMQEYKEGVWEALPAGILADWIRNIEEEFIDEDGFIPADRRANFMSGDIELDNRRAKVACRQLMGTGDGEYILKEDILTW